MVTYIKLWKVTDAWIPWNAKALEDWKKYIAIALPIAGCFYCEGIIFEINTILAGLFKDPLQLAAHVAMANTSTFFYFCGLGVNITITTYIGGAIGQNKKNEAIKYAIIGCIILLVILIIEEIVIWVYQE